MTRGYALTVQKANLGGERRFPQKGTTGHVSSAVMRCARGKWPVKTAAQLVALTGVSERGAKYWLAEQKEMSADALTRLLRSEQGLDFLVAVMGEVRPGWFKRLLQVSAIAEVRRRQRVDQLLLEQLERGEPADQRKLKGAIDADRDLTAAIARAETLLLQDADERGKGADAVGAMGGLRNRAVAAAGRRA